MRISIYFVVNRDSGCLFYYFRQQLTILRNRDRATTPFRVLARIFPVHRTRSGWMIMTSSNTDQVVKKKDPHVRTLTLGEENRIKKINEITNRCLVCIRNQITQNASKNSLSATILCWTVPFAIQSPRSWQPYLNLKVKKV